MVGLITGGQDVLQRHRYTLTALYGPESGRLMHWLDYAYDGLRPTLRLFSSDIDRTYGDFLQDSHGSADYTERVRTVGAAASLAFPGFDSSQAITIGYPYRELSGLTPLPPWPDYDGVLPATGPLGSTRLAWSFSTPTGSRSRSAWRTAAGSGSAWSTTSRGSAVTTPSPRPPSTGTSTSRFPRPATCWRPASSSAARTAARPSRGSSASAAVHPGAVEYALDDPSLLLRGYPPNTFRGERAVLGSLEYRFPLLEVGRGGVSAPFFLRRLHGALFVDAGEAWSDGAFRADELHAGVGAEVRFDLLFSYYLPLTVRLGIAAGLDEEGGVYPTLGDPDPPGPARIRDIATTVIES